MRLETFFDKFDLFADAPDAVAKMRELVLQLAVRGKLVAQRSVEGDAGSLIDDMSVACKRRYKGRASASTSIDLLTGSECWFDVPKSWRWVRLGNVGEIVGGGTPQSTNSAYFADQGIPWLTPADLNGFLAKRINRGRRFITQLGLDNSSARLLPEGSVLFSSRAPIGYVAIAGADLATNQGFKSCVPFVPETNEFLYYYLKSAASRIDREAPGTTFREVSGKAVSQIAIPLPPLAEQKRIVAKVDELMALCDRLEAQQQERETRHAALSRAALARFAEAPTPANLELLFHESFAIPPADLRKSILNLAVRGKLATRVSSNSVESNRREPMLTSGRPRIDLPNGWKWVQIGDVCELLNGDRSKNYPNKNEYVDEGVPWINTGHIEPDGTLSLARMNYISRHKFDSLRGGKVKPGDLVYCLRGATFGKTAIITQFDEGAVASSLVIIRLSESVQSRFAYLFLVSQLGRDQIFRYDNGSAQPNLSAANVKKFWMPLPPLADQRRIVAKVDELMALVDKLEAQLASARTTATHLLAAAVAEVTNGKESLSA